LVSVLALSLGREVVSLRESVRDKEKRTSLPYPGYVVPTLRTRTVADDSIVVGELADTNAHQLVFLFTTTCQFCLSTLPTWAELFDSVRAGKYQTVQVVGLSLDSLGQTREYGRKNGIEYPVAVFPGWKAVRHFRAVAVPQTMILNHVGQVIYARTGFLDRGPALDSLWIVLDQIQTSGSRVLLSSAYSRSAR
jgi:hypothetical protein